MGDTLLHRRKALGLKQREAAAILKVSKGTYAVWERNASPPGGKMLSGIAAFLDLPLAAVEAIIAQSEAGRKA